MSTSKNNFEYETTLMSIKQYYCLHAPNKNKNLISDIAGGRVLLLICLAEKCYVCVHISTASFQ